MKRRRTTVDLPEDLLVEILSRVPATSLARFRSTSRGWNALITKNARLAKKHFANSPKESLTLMLINSRVYSASVDLHEETHNNNVVLKEKGRFSLKDPFSEEVDISGISHCDGLLLCTTEDDRLVVWNPCSGETKWIQPPINSNAKLEFYAFGKSSTCNKYKILKLEQYNTTKRFCLVKFKIYDFNSDSWKDVGETRDWFIPPGRGRGISVNGNTYWLVSSRNVDDILMRFDFSQESFGIVSLPNESLSYHALALSELSVTREEQQLCVLATKSRQVFDIDVWVEAKIGESNRAATSWIKFISVGKVAYREKNLCFCCGMNFLVDWEKKVIVCCGGHGFSKDFVNIVGDDDTFIKVDHPDGKRTCSLLINYLPSLVQIQ